MWEKRTENRPRPGHIVLLLLLFQRRKEGSAREGRDGLAKGSKKRKEKKVSMNRACLFLSMCDIYELVLCCPNGRGAIHYPTSPYFLAAWLLLGSAKRIVNEKIIHVSHPSGCCSPYPFHPKWIRPCCTEGSKRKNVAEGEAKKGRRDNSTRTGDIICVSVLGKPRKNKFDLFIIRSLLCRQWRWWGHTHMQ